MATFPHPTPSRQRYPLPVMPTPTTRRVQTGARHFIIEIGILLGPWLAMAQTVPGASSPESKDTVTVLSPFEVDGSRDTRYRAASTLAGARLNTDLKDIASVIDVYTKEFMEDIG